MRARTAGKCGAEPGKRGVVASCAYEARRYGVHSAMPISEAARQRPPETVYVRPRMEDYARLSRQVMAALEGISPVVEKVSIDEAYLDVSGLELLVGPPEVIGQRAKAVIREAVGLTTSVGIGPNRLIAELASDFHKPGGLTVVPPEGVQAFLDPMPLTVLRGVGAKTAPRLQRLGLKTVGDVRRLSLEELRRQLGARAGTEGHLQARGTADDRVYPATESKSISKETVFAEDVTDPAVLRDTLRWAAQEVGFLARHEGRKGVVVALTIRFRPFETHNRSRTLHVRTASDSEILRVAWSLFEPGPWAGKLVWRIGVGLSGWEDETGVQADLFGSETPELHPQDERLDETLDAIRRKFGKGVPSARIEPAEVADRGVGALGLGRRPVKGIFSRITNRDKADETPYEPSAPGALPRFRRARRALSGRPVDPRDRVAELDRNPIAAADTGAYRNGAGRLVDWGDKVARVRAAKRSLPPEAKLRDAGPARSPKLGFRSPTRPRCWRPSG